MPILLRHKILGNVLGMGGVTCLRTINLVHDHELSKSIMSQRSLPLFLRCLLHVNLVLAVQLRDREDLGMSGLAQIPTNISILVDSVVYQYNPGGRAVWRQVDRDNSMNIFGVTTNVS